MNPKIAIILGAGVYSEANKLGSHLADHFEAQPNLSNEDFDLYNQFLAAYFKDRTPLPSEARRALGKSS